MNPVPVNREYYQFVKIEFWVFRHSCESRNPGFRGIPVFWIPAFAGMTATLYGFNKFNKSVMHPFEAKLRYKFTNGGIERIPIKADRLT